MIISNLKQHYSDFRFVKYMMRNALLQSSRWSKQNLFSSTFKRLRNFYRYLLGRFPSSSPLLTKTLLQHNKEILKISNNLYKQSKIVRYLFRHQKNVDRFYFGNDTPLKTFNKRLFNGTGLTFGFINIYCHNTNTDNNDDNDILSNKSKILDFRDYFKQIKNPIFDSDELREDIKHSKHVKFDDFISKGSCGAVHKGKIKDNNELKDVAIKILFNFDMSSNSVAIMNESIKECTPYRGKFGNISSRKCLSSHPNIVKILSAFVDEFKPLKNSKIYYPDVLPYQYGGFGHTRTLFIIQKLYDMSLKKYLELNPILNEQHSLAILTQCFEAIDFLSKNQITHRDIKPDNILVELPKIDNDFPWIVLTDFGLCSTSLTIPYETFEICKGGNRALMAPEIKIAIPNKGVILDYTKADLWSMATIAYEIFGASNPFYRKNINQKQALDGAYYSDEELPEFPSKLPLLSSMIKQILRRNPDERPSIWLVSGYCHLLLQQRQYGPSININITNNIIKMFKKLQNNQMMNNNYNNDYLKNWFKQLLYSKLYDIINNRDNISIKPMNIYRLQLIFLSKYNENDLIKIIKESLYEFII